MKKVVLASALLLSFGTAQATESPRWDSVSISYQSFDTVVGKLTGFAVSGNKLLGEDFFIIGDYGNASGDIEIHNTSLEADFNALSIGLGYRHSISQNTDFFGVVSYEDVEVEISHQKNSGSENGYGLTVGVHSMLSEKTELSGSLNYVDIADKTATVLGVSALYNFTEQFSADVGYSYSYSKDDYVDILSVSSLYNFTEQFSAGVGYRKCNDTDVLYVSAFYFF